MESTILGEVERIKTSCANISETTVELFSSIGMETSVDKDGTVDVNSSVYSADVDTVKAYTNSMCANLSELLKEKFGIERSFDNMCDMLNYLVEEFLPGM